MNRNLEISERRWEKTLDTRTYQLDQLFGLALTDDRFFGQLREVPEEALTRFALTESEEQAILDIVPSVSSIEELATRLEDWRACARGSSVDARAEERVAAPSTIWRLSPTNTTQAEPVPECVSYQVD